ncbi:SpoIIE family protein phosphatase [Streptomyces malaysiensis]|uniref:SpoIIE family protein phosphatase n=1 Tax=Streptomyces malaysiensis subsp. samsunensis TaxID=459658 RepID=A0A9X2M3Z5_STRMQ|nr:SpoIIE family protein phosphatase [Streptomyces samsunensis]MCQ8835216.1 SpoIIE family protein phosphatase [Streptomyces samsunensis]
MAGETKRRQTGNIPDEWTTFIGRRRESAEVLQLLSCSRLVTLTGPPGVGKTRLALHVAERLSSAYADGAWLVELAELTDPDLLVLTIIHAAGLHNPAVGTMEELTDYLRDRQMLLVLDNCEHLISPCATLVNKLLREARRLRVLATSREALGIAGEYTFEVPPLSTPAARNPSRIGSPSQYEAVMLFADRASAIAPGFSVTEQNQQTVIELCRRLDGLPLAVELAAGLMRALTTEQILRRLDDQHLLMTEDHRGSKLRHQTLRAAMDWSYQLCSKPEQILWARLAIFAGSFDLSAAEKICGDDKLPRDALLKALIGLVGKSILTRENDNSGGRYRILEAVRQYGHEKLLERRDDQMQNRRHRDYYLNLAERFDAQFFGPDEAAWLRRMETEHANQRKAMEFCFHEPGEARSGLKIAGTLWYYWLTRGALQEGWHWLNQGLAMDSHPSRERARALWVAGSLVMHQGEISRALTLLEESRSIAREIGDQSAAAHATYLSGAAEAYRDHSPRALVLLEEGVALEQDLNEPNACHALAAQHTLAWACLVSGDVERADALQNDCAKRCEALGDRALWSSALIFLGLVEWLRGHTRLAETQVRDVVRAKQDVHDFLGFRYAFEVLAWIAVTDGDGQRAARLFGASEQLWRPMGKFLGAFGAYERWHVQAKEQARRMLGDEAFHAALQQGARLSLGEAARYACGEQSRPNAWRDATAEAQVLTGREVAAARQRASLPSVLPALPAIAAAARFRYRSEHVGGDWYDAIRLSAGRVALVIGHVQSRGLDRAVVTGRLRTAVTTLSRLEPPPDEMLVHLADVVSHILTDIDGIDGCELRVTCLYAVYDPTTGTLLLASAGHPPPAILHPAASDVHFAEVPTGPPLGGGQPVPYKNVEFRLPDGSLLLLYTGGLIGPEPDLPRLADALARATATTSPPVRDPDSSPADHAQEEATWLGGVCEGLFEYLAFSGEPEQDEKDNAAVLAIRNRRLSEQAVAAWHLPFAPESAGQGRDHIRAQLASWGHDEMISTTELVVSELIGNCIRHARSIGANGQLNLRLVLSDVLTCEVSDGSEAVPHIRHPALLDESGRGLQLVAAMTERWGARYTADGKTIWTEQAL